MAKWFSEDETDHVNVVYISMFVLRNVDVKRSVRTVGGCLSPMLVMIVANTLSVLLYLYIHHLTKRIDPS